jgi:hypothetical protein
MGIKAGSEPVAYDRSSALEEAAMTPLHRSPHARRSRRRLPGLAALAAAAALLAPAAANASGPWLIDCPTGCVLTPDENASFTIFQDDYTVPDDGHSYLWTFKLVSDDPAATVFLDTPNETDGTTFYGGGGQSFFTPPFVFDEHVAPHLTTITVQTGKSFYNCTPATPVGQVCGKRYDIFGNASALVLHSQVPATFYTSAVMVPEPDAWTLMIAGFGAVGAMLRGGRRRTAAA